MTTSSNSHLTRMNNDQKMAEGLRTQLPTVGRLPIGKGTMTPEEIAQVFDERVAATQAVQAAAAAFRAAAKANRDLRSQTASLVNAARQIVMGMFVEAPDSLATFGLAPRRVGKRTVAAQTVAVMKNKATRQARHTLGKRQKEKIKGTVPDSVVQVVVGPPSSAPSGEAADRG
jgi:hypothetical protein